MKPRYAVVASEVTLFEKLQEAILYLSEHKEGKIYWLMPLQNREIKKAATRLPAKEELEWKTCAKSE